MTHADSILADSNLPFDCGANTPEGRKLLEAAPAYLWDGVNAAETHEDSVLAGDRIAFWIAANWQTVLPEIADRANHIPANP